jgi:D-glycero-alpha-D-manno-heptose-7-phosphate kinase
MRFCARSPLRIDFVGMTDYRPACAAFGGSIVNATINKYLYASAVWREDRRIVLNALDQEQQRVEIESAEALSPRGDLGLAQAILRHFDLPTGIELTTYSEMPSGAGLGSSSTIATCIIALLNSMTGWEMSDFGMALLAMDCEEEALATRYGWQDQFSPVTGGGVKYMRHWPSGDVRGIEINALPLGEGELAELQKSLVVCYTGMSRPAGAILHKVAEGFEAGDPVVVGGLKNMSKCAERIRVHLLEGHVEVAGAVLSEGWDLHKTLHPDVTNERIEELYEIAFAHGAVGGRVCGAGGGGTMLFHCGQNREYAVKQALRAAGATIFDFSFDLQGLFLWREE